MCPPIDERPDSPQHRAALKALDTHIDGVKNGTIEITPAQQGADPLEIVLERDQVESNKPRKRGIELGL